MFHLTWDTGCKKKKKNGEKDVRRKRGSMGFFYFLKSIEIGRIKYGSIVVLLISRLLSVGEAN